EGRALGAGETVLVLDASPRSEAGPPHAARGSLLDPPPPGMHLVLPSRPAPPLALPQLRALSQLTELRAADLRFSADEAAALLSEAAAPGLARAAGGARPAPAPGGGGRRDPAPPPPARAAARP